MELERVLLSHDDVDEELRGPGGGRFPEIFHPDQEVESEPAPALSDDLGEYETGLSHDEIAHAQAIWAAQRRVGEAKEALGIAVDEARDDALSWAWVGKVLGVSARGAWERFH